LKGKGIWVDGARYRVVGETTIDGRPHYLLAPLKRGPLRAIPVDVAPQLRCGGAVETGAAGQSVAVQTAGEGVSGAESPTTVRRTVRQNVPGEQSVRDPGRPLQQPCRLTAAAVASTIDARVERQVGVGCAPLLWLIGVIIALSMMFGK
jgi:hypothetical protein